MRKEKVPAWQALEGYAQYNAKTLCELHPRINDWIEAAPALALVTPFPAICENLKMKAVGGWRVKPVLRAMGIPPCLAKLDAYNVSRTPAHVLPFLIRMDNTKLGKHVNEWMYVVDCIANAVRDFPTEPDAAAWMIDHCRDYNQNQQKIIDYFANHEPRWDWSPKRIAKEHDLWVRQLRIAAVEDEAMKPENKVAVDIGESPEEVTIDGVTCRALVTPASLMMEGAVMAHCVGAYSFVQAMKLQTSQFYHLESEDEASTVEFQRIHDETGIVQHYGPHNALPSDAHRDAAKQLSEQIDIKFRSPDRFGSLAQAGAGGGGGQGLIGRHYFGLNGEYINRNDIPQQRDMLQAWLQADQARRLETDADILRQLHEAERNYRANLRREPD